MTSSRSKRRVLGAALAGILAGATWAVGCGNEGEATTTEANGCNGPNGCGGGTADATHADDEASSDANSCNGPNGCGAAAETDTEAVH